MVHYRTLSSSDISNIKATFTYDNGNIVTATNVLFGIDGAQSISMSYIF